MSSQTKGLVVGGVCVVVFVIIYVVMGISYRNSEVRLRNLGEAQQENLKVVYDKVWKVISGQAQVAEKYKESFAEIYPALMEGRYGNARGGALLSFIQESNPNFDTKLFEKLSNSIEALRTEFAREQTKLLSIQKEHKNLLQTFPGSHFISGKDPIDIQLVTSGKTKKTFETGEENDVNVFE